MTPSPACCSASTSLREVARLMLEHDCGQIPVVDAHHTPVGVVTDRDIVLRTLAVGIEPGDRTAGDCMSTPCLSVKVGTSLTACCELMEAMQVRRVPVVDANGKLCGIVSLADVAQHAAQDVSAEVLKEVSEPAIEFNKESAQTA